MKPDDCEQNEVLRLEASHGPDYFHRVIAIFIVRSSEAMRDDQKQSRWLVRDGDGRKCMHHRLPRKVEGHQSMIVVYHSIIINEQPRGEIMVRKAVFMR